MSFSWKRIEAISVKEFLHMLRNPIVLMGMIFLPFIQVILFAALFNFSPRHLPTAIVTSENTDVTRSIVRAFQNTHFFNVVTVLTSEQKAEDLMAESKIKFIVNILPGFSRELIRKTKPNILLIADFSNPIEVNAAIKAANSIPDQALDFDLIGNLKKVQPSPPAFNIIVHERYNPGEFPFYFSIPAILTIAISLALLNFATDSIVREVDQGTIESLLVTPARPYEVIFAKMSPYLVLGLLQLILIIMIAHFIYQVPFRGNAILLVLATLPTMIASIALGLIFSILTKNEFAAVELGTYWMLLNLLFSGLILPFSGMPIWGQWIGNILPVTHLMRIMLNIMLKGSSFLDIWPDLWPTLVFMIVSLIVIVTNYQRKFG